MLLLIPHRGNGDLKRRVAFTLIELLIVIAIIALLVSLTASATMRILSKGPEITTGIEIGQLATAIESFKRQYNVDYLPSSIVLDEACNYPNRTTVGSADWFAVTYLRKLFPRINLTARTSTDITNNNWIDWNGNGTCDHALAPAAQNSQALQGHEALVLFLGGVGIKSGTNFGLSGFCTDPTNPAPPPLNSSFGLPRQQPFFDFKNGRLAFGPPHKVANDMFLVYTDAYGHGSPYVYFSHYAKGNDYVSADCNTVLGGNPPATAILPFTDPTGRFINPNGYQIISAGRDGFFGPGGMWNPTNPGLSSGYQTGGSGADDQANFSRSLLGVGQN
jgi:prepilin-type N-terminal cleavage/methylation domain-containing protein